MTAWCVTLICYLKLVLTDTQCKVDVRFTPESGHLQCTSPCPLYPPKADMGGATGNVRLWPLADIPIALMSVRFLDFMALSAHARPPKTSYTLL
jgi:hypothetical protein